MNTILALFWFGFLICAAVIVFKIVLTIGFYILCGIAIFIGWVWDLLSNNEKF